VKVAMHYSRKQGESPEVLALRHCDPEHIEREVKDWEVTAMKAMLQGTMPTLCGDLQHTATCMYTLTPDEHL
jgi:hypothetical protein